MTRPRAILFDHDGTLVDSESIHCALWSTVLAEYGASMDHADYFAHFAGVPTPTNARRIAEFFSLEADAALLARKKEIATRAFLSKTPFPLTSGAREVVADLKDKGFTVGIVTGADAAAAATTVQAHFGQGIFTCLISGDDVQRSKPAPDCYELAARMLGLSPAECVAIEDTPTGVAAASAAGIRAVAVPGPLSGHQDFSRAAHVARNLFDARDWILDGLMNQ